MPDASAAYARSRPRGGGEKKLHNILLKVVPSKVYKCQEKNRLKCYSKKRTAEKVNT